MYRLNMEENSLKMLKPITYSQINISERFDIEVWLEKKPELLGEPLLIIAKEFFRFDKTKERLDLAALDLDGNVVIIELKRDDSGTDVTWQAIKYTSYFSTLTNEQIFEVYAEYKGINEEEARQEIESFIKLEDALLNQDQRIILVSREFRPEVTSSAMWLINKGLDVKCVTIQPYLDEVNNEVFIVPTVIIPPPNTDDYLIRVAKKERETVSQTTDNNRRSQDEISQFMFKIRDNLISKEKVNELLTPFKHSRWAGEYDGIRYFKIWSNKGIWDNHMCSFQVNMSPEGGSWLSKKELDVCFWLNSSYGRSKGIVLEDFMKEIDALLNQDDYLKKFSRSLNEEELYFNQRIEYIELDDGLIDKVTNLLERLIITISPCVNKFS